MMSAMRSVVVDKIASVTQALSLTHEIRIAPEIPCEEGVVIVVEILNNKSTYNTLELTSGRMAKVARGEIRWWAHSVIAKRYSDIPATFPIL